MRGGGRRPHLWSGPQLKKSREKIQKRGAILNFFEFVRTGAPYAQQGPGPKSKTGSGGTLFWTWAWTLFWSWALGGGCPPWALIVNGVIVGCLNDALYITKELGHGHSSPWVGCAFLSSAHLYKLSRHVVSGPPEPWVPASGRE